MRDIIICFCATFPIELRWVFIRTMFTIVVVGGAKLMLVALGEMVSSEEPENITGLHLLQRIPGWLNLYENSCIDVLMPHAVHSLSHMQILEWDGTATNQLYMNKFETLQGSFGRCQRL